MKNRRIPAAVRRVAMGGVLVFASACGRVAPPRDAPLPADFLESRHGQVLVLLLGMEGCPGTEKATPFIADFGRTAPAGVEVWRIDIPPFEKTLSRPAMLDSNLKYAIDHTRALANRLEFFFYPTLYIIDRDGVVRYGGKCDPGSVRRMTDEICAEPPGAAKKSYTPPMPPVGGTIRDAPVMIADGSGVMLKSLAGAKGLVLYFSSADCPFSLKGVKDLARIRSLVKDDGMRYAMVGFGENSEAMKKAYAGLLPGVTLVPDPRQSVSETFGVSAVPFFFVLDSRLKIVARAPFTPSSALNAVCRAAGIPLPQEAAPPKTGGG